MDKILNKIGNEYKLEAEKLNLQVNAAIVRTFLQKEKTKKNDDEDDVLNFIFRGNDKLNFGNRIKDQDLIIMIQILEPYRELIKNIDLSYNEITNSGAIALAKLLCGCPSLESLNLQGNKIESQGAEKIAEGLQESFTLQYFNMDYNDIHTEGTMSLIQLLIRNKSLLELNLGNNGINHDGIIGITSVLNWNNSTLQVLNLDDPVYTSIGQETSIHIGKMLQSNRGLEKISLKKHKFNDDALYIITEHLLENNKLRYHEIYSLQFIERVLDLTANKISFRGCEALAKYLCGEYCVLESLILTSNRTGHFGAKAIAQALSKNRTLIHLDMVRNDIDDNGLKMIAESLETNDMLVSLKLYHNNFGQMALQAFHKLRLKPRQGDWFWDFHTYIVDQHIEMACLENNIPYDISVSKPYFA